MRRSSIAGLEREIWQSFAVLPDIRTVGVMGDERTYGYPVIIRAVTSEDAMTADWARIPYEVLETMASRIINEVAGRQPGRLRHHVQAARHDRVGVTGQPRSGRRERRSDRSSMTDCNAIVMLPLGVVD